MQPEQNTKLYQSYAAYPERAAYCVIAASRRVEQRSFSETLNRHSTPSNYPTKSTEIVSVLGNLIVPGLINSHVHLANLARRSADQGTFSPVDAISCGKLIGAQTVATSFDVTR